MNDKPAPFMVGFCRDCRHFETNADWEPRAAGWGWCNLASSWGDDDPPHPESLAFARDAENFRAEIEVSPDFGCIQFEGKE